MTRNLKALGLGLIAALAMSAVVASAAQGAIKVTVASSPAILTAEGIGSQKYTINPNTAEPASFTCKTVGGTATVKNGDTSITVTNVTSSNCSATIGANTLPVTVDNEGCDNKLHGGVKDKEDHFTGGEEDLVCPAGTGPVITVFSDAEHKTRVCKYTVWSFVNKGGFTLENTTGGIDDVDGRATNVTTEITRNEGILCPKPKEAAVANGEITVKAFEDKSGTEGSQVSLTASE